MADDPELKFRTRVLIAFTGGGGDLPVLIQAPKTVWDWLQEAGNGPYISGGEFNLDAIPQPQRGPSLYECEIEYFFKGYPGQPEESDDIEDGFKVMSYIERPIHSLDKDQVND